MAQLVRFNAEKRVLEFRVPGHAAPFEAPHDAAWNGDASKPTFAKSIAFRPEGVEVGKGVFVEIRAGRLHFHPGSAHELAGQVVDMLPFDETAKGETLLGKLMGKAHPTAPRATAKHAAE